MYLNKRQTPNLIRADIIPGGCYLKNWKLSWFAACYSLQNRTKQNKENIISPSKCKFIFLFVCGFGFFVCTQGLPKYSCLGNVSPIKILILKLSRSVEGDKCF